MRTITQKFAVSYSYQVLFTRGLFDPGNVTLAGLLGQTGKSPNRALVVIDSEVARLTTGLLEKISNYGKQHDALIEFAAPPFIVRGGEICKQEPQEVDKIHSLVERHRLCRHSFIIAIGGGAVLDAAGYAAATAHRGVRLIRMPTTVLAQNDAGVGVKNGVNSFGRKNFLGTFAPPFAVINDLDFLHTLPSRELRSGIAEAVKVALIRDRSFFDSLYSDRKQLALFEPAAMERMIFRCAELHLEHIATSGDPFEFGSSRPLDFGHWNAHKLEELTGGEIRHGEAVAIGIALDSLYSSHSGLLGDLDLRRILSLLEDLGFSLYHPALSWLDVEKALREFQEHLGGELTIPLLEGIGKKIEAHQLDTELMRHCINLLAERRSLLPVSLPADPAPVRAKEN
ncbi:3-dehydroquinate synthase [Geobacter sp. OR-1]|uniref:3-dehydroquinate synthase n=1 Tax=Geobacter sp. OR-1 TaxID=1266765 RepID=UPI0005436127|nr:3-dehydroquinate synthase [Geobacter sp. OR-1]GAM10013.1 3-dehydroquinate synthase [Geobacter sp. OR-1]